MDGFASGRKATKKGIRKDGLKEMKGSTGIGQRNPSVSEGVQSTWHGHFSSQASSGMHACSTRDFSPILGWGDDSVFDYASLSFLGELGSTADYGNFALCRSFVVDSGGQNQVVQPSLEIMQ